MAKHKKFDVFLSYRSTDKPWVRHLKDMLQNRGISVWLDQDEIRPGDLFASALEKGLEESSAVALIVSPEALMSGWVKEEYYRALSLAQSKSEPLQLIPVILREAKLPGFLANRTWIDFRDESTVDKDLERLMWGITGKKPMMFAQKPLKKRALLDRRLVTDLILFYSHPSETRTIDFRTRILLEFGLGIFEQLLVEKMYGSTLWRLLSIQKNPFKDFFMFIDSLTEEENEEFALAVEDATAIWAKHPQFQLAISQYDRTKGSNIGDIKANIAYLDTNLRLARQLESAIIPHPDRWTLYNWWFEQCIWAMESETSGKSVGRLPETSIKLPEAGTAGIRPFSSNSVLLSKQTIALIRYGPISYPFPKGILRRYSLEDITSFQTSLYEFVVSIPDDVQ